MLSIFLVFRWFYVLRVVGIDCNFIELGVKLSRIGLLPTNFLDLDIFEMLYDLYAISKYVRLWFEQ